MFKCRPLSPPYNFLMYGGIDLAAKVENKTGTCILSDTDEIKSDTILSDESIIKKMDECSVIAIDAPLSITERSFRKAERELMRDFGPILPLNTPGMKTLSRRAVELRKSLEEKTDAVVIETYPRAVEKSLGWSRSELDTGFKNEHEYDAYLCAVTAKKYAQDRYKEFGEKDETIVLPLSNG